MSENRSQTVVPENLAKVLADMLFKFNKESVKDADDLMREASINMFGAIIEGTPVSDDIDHDGTLKGNWVISEGASSTSLPNARMPNRVRGDIASEVPMNIISGGKNLFMTNNSEYINVIEYGGYPQPAKKGGRTIKGFSRQAPKGMVRINTAKWPRFIELAANKIL